MRHLKLLLSGVLLLYSVVLLGSFFLETNYILELLIMLTPYWILINIVFLALFLPKTLKKITSPTLFNISVLVLLITTSCLLTRFLIFNFTTSGKNLLIKSAAAATTEKNFKIAFLNKLYSNTNYAELDSKIKIIDPDIIGFSEFKSIDKNQISTLSNYPYFFSVTSRDNATISYFSKFKSERELYNSPFVLPIKLTLGDQQLEVFVIHPVPPINNSWLAERNSELTALASYVKSNEKTIIMGDFNLTPWSPVYQELATNLINLKDTSQGQGLNSTWHSGILKTQIDHIFVPNSTQIVNFGIEPIKGSDHNLIWTQIVL